MGKISNIVKLQATYSSGSYDFETEASLTPPPRAGRKQSIAVTGGRKPSMAVTMIHGDYKKKHEEERTLNKIKSYFDNLSVETDEEVLWTRSLELEPIPDFMITPAPTLSRKSDPQESKSTVVHTLHPQLSDPQDSTSISSNLSQSMETIASSKLSSITSEDQLSRSSSSVHRLSERMSIISNVSSLASLDSDPPSGPDSSEELKNGSSSNVQEDGKHNLTSGETNTVRRKRLSKTRFTRAEFGRQNIMYHPMSRDDNDDSGRMHRQCRRASLPYVISDSLKKKLESVTSCQLPSHSEQRSPRSDSE